MDTITCSFCERPHNKADTVASPSGLALCGECLALMSDIMSEQNDPWRRTRIKSLES